MSEENHEEEEELFEHYNFVADKGQAVLRIDKFLSDRLPNSSRNKIQQSHSNNMQINMRTTIYNFVSLKNV